MSKEHIDIRTIPEDRLTSQQKSAIERLFQQCFSDVPQAEIEECFIAQSFSRVLAYEGSKLVGHLRLFKRDVEFDGRKIVLGGFGGACVSENMRNRKIATRLMRKSFQILKDKNCDVACLNADLRKTSYKFYEKIGFKLMDRQISFEDVNGKTRYESGTMFIPICSKKAYDHIMTSSKVFHYGKGYW